MIVEKYMSKNVITIKKEAKVFDAVETMNQHQIHRLPVVENGKLIGLITEGNIQEAMPSKATSLSVYEVNYLLNKTTVADVMIRQVQTIGPDALLEDGIAMMRKHHVGVLPVVNHEQQIVGIITNNDIFDAFLEITGYNQQGTRVSVYIPQDHKGVLAKLTQLFADNDLSIVQLVVFRREAEPTIVFHLASKESDRIQKLLVGHGYQVENCILVE